MPDPSEFLYPRSRYYGEFRPEYLVFDANLQEFAQKVTYICSLETGGKIPPVEAYEQIRKLWLELEQSKDRLGLEKPPEDPSAD
ncbi:hypothetical protein PN466_14580 [Roseofilum reptotaenium CS-1145]|uniref:Isopropylmalate/homocitrate/citramalate synthase n=1 Tax=Roseofilum reptotaenium AO1-A TaxID=1925591 RepID=A0A1L9QT00_9CYAN|nr:MULTISPECIES: hypothetical protein [Roseofilum]MBP0029816.1 hypothetical protein [Roseofilum sp. Guam]MDB9518174.1 hypothetical protein [Roseofilum reptotaenium CS-1145]OJJ25772.1 hypothetical protein BI308_09620 [Roseofilum reptotaenium AO1-A]